MDTSSDSVVSKSQMESNGEHRKFLKVSNTSLWDILANSLLAFPLSDYLWPFRWEAFSSVHVDSPLRVAQ